MVRSLLVAHDIPYYVHNDGYASLFPGIQMHLLNVPIVMVPAPLVESAKKLLDAYIPDVADHLRPTAERSPWHILRMLFEGLCCGWFVPRIGVSRKVSTEP
jgi:hypothetical protein